MHRQTLKHQQTRLPTSWQAHVLACDYISTLALSQKSLRVQFQLLTAAAAVAAIAVAYAMYKRAASATYLVDFYSFRPPSRQAPEPLCIASCNLLARG